MATFTAASNLSSSLGELCQINWDLKGSGETERGEDTGGPKIIGVHEFVRSRLFFIAPDTKMVLPGKKGSDDSSYLSFEFHSRAYKYLILGLCTHTHEKKKKEQCSVCGGGAETEGPTVSLEKRWKR